MQHDGPKLVSHGHLLLGGVVLPLLSVVGEVFSMVSAPVGAVRRRRRRGRGRGRRRGGGEGGGGGGCAVGVEMLFQCIVVGKHFQTLCT